MNMHIFSLHLNQIWLVHSDFFMGKKGFSKSQFVCPVFLLILSFFRSSYAAKDTILAGQFVGNSDTIVSTGRVFELGFFKPGNSSSSYLGIWYKSVSEQTVVWVANRDYALFTSAAVLTISNGNLLISEGKIFYKVSDSSLNKNVSATLLDSGNLVMRDEDSNIVWQSFDFPSDTFLPGMKIGYDKKAGKNWSYVSWKSSEDPSPGDFTLEVDPESTNQFVIMNGNEQYWTSGPWNGRIFSLVPEMRLNYIFNYSYFSDENSSYFTYDLYDKTILSRCVMDITGQIKQQTWLNVTKQWNLFWSQPRQQCEVYDYCGAFGVCNENSLPYCECLPGFEPYSNEQWDKDNFSGGCRRKVDLQCGNNSHPLEFMTLSNLQLPVNATAVAVQSIDECRLACLNNCSCSAYSYFQGSCGIWVIDLHTARQLSADDKNARDFHIKVAVANSEKPGSSRNLWIIIVPTISSAALALGLLFYRIRMKKRSRKGEDLLSFDFTMNEESAKQGQAEVKRPKNDKKEVEIPLFSFSSVSAATSNFSAINKLGEGGFGPVYKGKLLNGHEVAVKRLSRGSGQGWEELKNEAMLIAKLQHKNLVKLLGCCIEGDEKILIYEFLPNKSLDFFLFDPTKYGSLDWITRSGIIDGVAQGLLYLHQFSRLQIIHRDLKASNILLDGDMNPKISDFGMARIFGGTGPQATNRIVGTYGYMAPEYALEGVFSVKSDVFSFGVLLLEILSSKKNTGFYQSDSLDLLGHAWDLWTKDMPLELMDPTLLHDISSVKSSLLRYINIALLCVQEDAADRPTMSDVVLMLSNELMSLPSPKQPAFSNVRSVVDPCGRKRNPEVYSVNEVTVSLLQAR